MTAVDGPADPASGTLRSALSVPRVPRAMRLTQHVLFAVLLAVGLATALTSTTAAGWLVGGTIAITVWYLAGVRLAARRRSQAGARVWLAGLVALWAALIVGSAQFVWLAFSLFFLLLFLLPVRVAGGAVLAVTAGAVAGLVAHTSAPRVPQIVGPLLGAAVATSMAMIYRALLREGERRRHLVEELVAAQDDLVATHDALARTQREAGMFSERARIARDIHDTLAQGLSSILLHARAARECAAEGRNVRASLDRIEEVAARNLEEARRLVGALAPADLENSPLAEALQRLTDRLHEHSAIDARFVSQGDPYPMPTGQEVALLRVAQSALANARQHAAARRVGVTLSYLPDAVTLDVVDDGVGFDPGLVETAALGGTGFGLRAMRARITEIGGRFVLETTPGEGTAVAATLPRAQA